MSFASKRPLQELINKRWPSVKASSVDPEEMVLYYDAYAFETEVQAMKQYIDSLGLNIKIEQRPF